ncbi:hypothetical protein D3C72_1124530 [compost metagenome]
MVSAVIHIAFFEIQCPVVNSRIEGLDGVNDGKVFIFFSKRLVVADAVCCYRIVWIDIGFVDRIDFFSTFWSLVFYFDNQVDFLLANGTVHLHQDKIGIEEIIAFFFESGVDTLSFFLDDL